MMLLLSANAVNAKEKIKIKLKQSAQHVWQREQVLLTLEIKTDDPFSRLEVQNFQQKGFSIIPFKQQRLEKKDHTLLSITWALFPFVAGEHILELPRVRYRPNRGRIQTLELQEPSIQVRRLPVYVPPTMPVGEISLKNSWDDGWLVGTNNLLEWKVRLEGNAVAKQTMPPITRQLVSTDSLQFFPVQNTLESVKSGGGVKYQQHYKVPLKPLNNGLVELPDITVQYFDPQKGKLQSASLVIPRVVALSNWLIWLIGFVLLVIASLLAIYLFNVVKTITIRASKKKQALKLLASSENYHDIRNSINQLSKAYGWDENLSLSNFISLWEKEVRHAPSSELHQIMNKLQADEFSSTEKLVENSGIKQLVEKLVILLR